MNSPRPNKNAEQVRSIIQNMSRSIDEARNRRLGPVAAPVSAPASAPVRASESHQAVAPAAVSPAQRASHSSSSPPPVRTANEMFAQGGDRLKARPKRAG
ncbi:MAG: hypothetical protein LW636_08310 [Planctomycetaceae bacterium]|jgi:hypothetical protein|nr:hypothetical protein [Planctomycetaceae bacterium]